MKRVSVSKRMKVVRVDKEEKKRERDSASTSAVRVETVEK